MLSMESLSISDAAPGLTTLPTDIFYIILTYLDTAKSVAHLAATCKGLHNLITETGWRIFVTTRFNTFTLSEVSSADEWRERARSLTSQSRDWDRRGLIVTNLKPLGKYRGRPFGRFRNSQSIPSSIMVDAHHQRKGNDARDLIFWGAGEDIFGLVQHTRAPKEPVDEWLCSKGATAGYSSGKDDVTCVSILKDEKYNFGQGDEPQVLVGRASGQLHLVSMGTSDFGTTLLSFRGPRTSSSQPDNNAIRQTEIQSLDVNYKQGTLVAATKQNILSYSLSQDGQTIHNGASENGSDAVEPPHVWADDALALKAHESGPKTFDFIRSVKFVNGDTLAVGLSKCSNPLQYLKYTPTGVEITSAAKARRRSSHSSSGYKLRTVRAILPLDTSSIAYSSGNAMLSSWDDGTVRLQDLRTPSPVDRIFQDNFDTSTPLNTLLSRGLERFVGGCAQSVLKVFDYRWPKRYYHTEALPCGNDKPYPTPRHPTVVAKPTFPDDRLTCDYMTGRRCRWHTLSQHDFYRPNYNMWLSATADELSPVYTLASPSDDSPILFAGLSGALVKVSCKSSAQRPSRCEFGPTKERIYYQRVTSVAFIDTGTGSPLSDISQSQRVPPIQRQVFTESDGRKRDNPESATWRKRHRLDELLQDERFEAELEFYE